MEKVVLCVLLLVCVGAYSVSAYGSDTGKWLESLRPAMLPVYMKREQTHHTKPDPTKYFNRHLGILDVIRMFVKDHGNAIDHKMEEFFKDMINTPPSEEQALTCPFDVQCPSVPRDDYMTSYRKAVDSLQAEPASCDPCQLTVDVLRERACEQTWETMRDNIIVLCEDLLFPLLGIDPVMCNGTITLQGPHLYCMVREATSFEMCESLNQCYPVGTASESKTNPPMSQRIPPEVKARRDMKKAVQTKKHIKSKKRVRRQSGRVRVIQMTDIHVQPEYMVGSAVDCTAAVCCIEESIAVDGSAYARKWGEYRCNLPERTLIKFLERINDFSPDFVIYAGDSPPHTLWDETQQSQLNISNIVVNDMKNYLTPGTRVYPTIGNHEMFPTNLYSSRLTETDEMTDAFTSMWHDLVGFDSAANGTFADMSYYTKLERPGLRILSINTNYDWYTANFYNTVNRNDTSNADHKQFVETTLANARTAGEKVVIIGHHPVGGAVVRAAKWWHDVIMEYGDVIVLHVSGHTHIDEYHIVVDPATDEAKGVNLVSPTVTTNTRINPSFRLFELDDVTFELLDYQCYFFEVDIQNPEADPEIVLNYDPRVDYNMTDLSPAGWQDLTLRFIDDEPLFQLWYANRHAMAEAGPCALDGVCADSCKRNQICGIWFPSADDYDSCVENWDNMTFPFATGSQVHAGAPSVGVQALAAMLVSLVVAIFVI